MLREKLMKNILLLTLLSTILFVGCSSKTIEIVESEPEREIIMEVDDVKKVDLNVIEDNIVKDNMMKNNIVKDNVIKDNIVKDNVIKDNIVKDIDINLNKKLDDKRQKMELKKRLDEEALINSDKKLNLKEIKSYIIDENTPLILKNQSKDRAYE